MQGGGITVVFGNSGLGGPGGVGTYQANSTDTAVVTVSGSAFMNFTVTTDSSVTLQALAALTLGGTSQSYNNTYFLGPGTSTWSFSSTELSITSTLVPATYEVSLGETLTSINGPAYSGSPFPPIIKSVTVLPFNNMVPEIDPGSMASALTLLIGGVLTLTGRQRRQSLALASH